MVIGGYSPARNTFAESLAVTANVPLVEIERFASDFDPASTPDAAALLTLEADQRDWIMLGNGFDHDETARIERARILFNFDFPSAQIFKHHIGLTQSRRAIANSKPEYDGKPAYMLQAAQYFIYKVLPEAQQKAVANARDYGVTVRTFTTARQSTHYMDTFVKQHKLK